MLEGLSHLFDPSRPAIEILRDFGDILIVAFIIYRALVVLKGTRAMQMGLGFLVFGALYLLAKYAALATLMQVLSWLASSAILILVVVFQNDIRRALINVGERAWFRRGENPQEKLIEEVVAAASDLARHRWGALMVLERDANVRQFVKKEGIKIDAMVSKELLMAIFNPIDRNPTHDGAVIINNLRISHVGATLPTAERKQLKDAAFGTRHQAAIGISEETDAVVVVVSEERGWISIVHNDGEMETELKPDVLRERLKDLFGRPGEKKSRMAPFRRGRKTSPALSMKPVSEKKEKKDSKPEKKVEKKADATAPKSGPNKPPANSPKPNIANRPSVPPPSERAPNLADAVKANKQSGGFRAMAREETTDEIPVAARVSVPMPSSKDRKSGDVERVTLPVATDDDKPDSRPSAAHVSKPMTPTDLPGTPMPTAGDDS